MGDQGGLAHGTNEKAWRAAIADELFSEAAANIPLYVYLEPERFAAVAAKVGVSENPRAAFGKTISAVMRWRSPSELWGYWRAATAQWIAEGKVGAPPSLALLVCLTLAAESMVADAEHAAHNYYDRLANLLGLNETETDQLKDAFPETIAFWQSLNDWLEDWQGERGWPTARAHDRRRYIGYPLSQALVREQDRRGLHAAFEHYQLQPMRVMSAAEMTVHLADWFGDSANNMSANLRRLWFTDQTARRRIAEIACAELSHWTGHGAYGAPGSRLDGGSRALKLDWIADLAYAPTPRLDLFLVARTDPELAVGAYRVSALTDDAGRASVAGCLDRLRLERLPGMRWASLEPWPEIGVTSLFSGVIELVSASDSARLYRKSPTPIIVLEAEEGRNQFHEIPRAQLFKQNLVLAHASAAPLVEGHLAKHARPGWRKFADTELTNLPAGWCAYCDVMIVKAADEATNPKLEPLSAGAATIISFSGGLQLGNAWHAARPPELLAAVDTDGTFDLAINQRGRDGIGRHLGHFVGRGVVDLTGKVGEGDHDIVLRRPLKTGGMGTAETASLRLRTADTPRPVGARDVKERRFDLSGGAGLLASSESCSPGSASLAGCDLSEPLAAQELGQPALTGPEMIIFARPSARDAPYVRTTRVDQERFVQSCAVRGYHHWICEEGRAGDNFRTLKHQQCETCHRQDWTRNRGVRKRFTGQRRGARVRRALSEVPRYRRLTETPGEAFDLLLDAATYLTSGSYERFRTLAGAVSEEEGFPAQAARTLSALGHLDFDVDPRDGSVHGWRVAPSCLVETADGAWVLAGARSKSFVARLRGRVAQLDGRLIDEPMTGGPERVAFVIAPEALSLLAETETPLGRPLLVASKFSARLISCLPVLSAVLGAMPSFRMGSDGVEAFDLDEGKWGFVDHDAPGAYRVGHHGLRYGYSSPEDAMLHMMRVGDVHLIKHLAAAQKRLSMIMYQKQDSALLVPLGAYLPGFYERVAVMCSGKAPRYRADAGLIQYDDVPLAVAISIQNKLHA
ncbi:MAG: hypothetical protein K2P70_08510 [Hyphomonadaceae bacterium]|nr:hypothetical protein [Hyphomonadaceae bacterium]